MNVVVTGGAGYIGSHVCKCLAQEGFVPVCFDNLTTGNRWSVKWGPFEFGELSDSGALERVFSSYKPPLVIHMAGSSYVGESVLDPAKYYMNNVVGTLNLVESMRKCGISNIIFSSSCATYGNPMSDRIREDHPQNPVNPYGESKFAIEKILRDYDLAYGMRSISLRYFNAAGADVDLEIGEAHEPETHLIPNIIGVVLGKSEFVTINGNDYGTPDGTCIRDYIHISDIARAHLLAMHALTGGMESGAFNLSNQSGFSVGEVISSVERVTSSTIRRYYGARREGDPPILVGDSTKIREQLGWTPQYQTIDSIIESAWRWHKVHG